MVTLDEIERWQQQAHNYFTISDAGQLISDVGTVNFLENVLYCIDNPKEANIIFQLIKLTKGIEKELEKPAKLRSI